MIGDNAAEAIASADDAKLSLKPAAVQRFRALQAVFFAFLRHSARGLRQIDVAVGRRRRQMFVQMVLSIRLASWVLLIAPTWVA